MSESLAASFDPVSLAQWREKVGERAADGVPTTPIEDGIEVPWLFVSDDLPTPDPAGTPGEAPFTRGVSPGTAWDVRQEQRLGPRDLANRAILADLEGGATSIVVRLDEAGCDGISPDDDGFAPAVGRGGVAVYTVDDLDALLHGVFLDLAPIALHAGAGGAQAAALLIALWQRRGHDLDTIAGALNLDPLGALAASGRLHDAPESELARVGRTTAQADELLGPAVTVLGVDTAPYVAAGASTAQELGIALASAVAYLRAGEAAGLAPERTATRLSFTLQGDADQFVGIAKLRAARRMWARVLEACEVPAERRRSPIVSRTSERMLASVDPWVNMLRATSAAFAAAVGGADAITVSPFDAPRTATSELGRRIARNTQHILADESHLARVGDPGGGAWYVEWLTDRLAHAGWSRMQAIESAGGMLAVLQDGSVATQIAAAAETRTRSVSRGERMLTGVSAFPLLGPDGMPEADQIDLDALARSERERLRARPPTPASVPGGESDGPSLQELVNRAASGARIDELGAGRAQPRLAPLAPTRDGAGFEALRGRAAELDPTPSILVACAGPVARHNASATWARNFFGAGGIEPDQTGPLHDGDEAAGAAAQAGRAPLAVIAADADEDPALLRAIAGALHENGVGRVYLAQATDERARSVGADAGVADGIDMVAVLTHALDLWEGSGA